MEAMLRKSIVDELTRLGVYETSMSTFSDNVLEAALLEYQKVISELPNSSEGQRNLSQDSFKLNRFDIKILKHLVNSKERLSVLSLSRELGIPVTTVQRRRKRLENDFLTTRYTLKYEKFGFRRAILLVSTNSGGTAKGVGNKILKEQDVISVEIIIGENNMNIVADVLFRENNDLLNIIEKLKRFDGIDKISWTEIVEVLQAKPDAALNMLEQTASN